MFIRRLLVIASVLVLLAGCDSNGGGDGDAPSEVTGVVTDIDSAGIDDVRGFTLVTQGQTYEIKIADDVDYGFPLGHLQEHRTSAEPVRVELDERDDGLYALSIEDA